MVVYTLNFDFVSEEVSDPYEEIVNLHELKTTVKVYSRAAETITRADVIVLISR